MAPPPPTTPAILPGTRTLVVINPGAGAAHTARVLRLLAGAFAVRGASFDVVQTSGPGDGEAATREAVRQGYRAVVAAGGDGTVSEVINGLAGTPVPLAILPKGTGNQVACNLGIPMNVERAVDVAVNGTTRAIDLGVLGDGRYFALSAGAGWDAAMVIHATRALKARWGTGAYIYAGLRLGISRPTSAKYRIVADGTDLEVEAVLVLLANMGEYRATRLTRRGLNIGPEVSFTDGLLDVCVFAARRHSDVAAVLWRVARRRYAGDHRMIFLKAREVTVEAEPAVATQVDGELLDETPLTARAAPAALNVLVPDRR